MVLMLVNQPLSHPPITDPKNCLAPLQSEFYVCISQDATQNVKQQLTLETKVLTRLPCVEKADNVVRKDGLRAVQTACKEEGPAGSCRLASVILSGYPCDVFVP